MFGLTKRKEEKKPSTALAVVEDQPKQTKGDLVERENTDIVERRSNELQVRRGPGNGGAIVQVRSREIMLAGEKRKVDPYQLIRMVKRVTQNIGEYKGQEDVYSKIVIGALRKARGDLVNSLEHNFGIHWQIDEETGQSIFYM